MKAIKRLSLLFLLPLLAVGAIPNTPVNITLAWTPEPSVDLFKIYASPDVTIPLTNWFELLGVPGTNSAVTISVMPGQMFFFLTASNFWGESGPSNVAGTPPVPPGTNTIQIRRGP